MDKRDEKTLLINNAKIIDGSGSEPFLGSILIKGNKIASVLKDTKSLSKEIKVNKTIDAKQKTVLPGLIDAHCHISFDEPSSNDELFFHRRESLAAIVAGTNALKVLQSGVTSFLDADSIYDVGVDLRDAIEAGVIPGPRMAVGGNALLTSVGGTAGRLIPDEGKRGYGAVVRNQDEIILEIRRQIKLGVDWIKIHVSGLVPRQKAEGELKAWSLEELKIACDTAHELGIPVVGHCRSADSVKDSLLAGMDMILHATYMDEEGLEILVDKKIPIVPTFTFQANLIEYADEMGASKDYKEIFQKEIDDNIDILQKAYKEGVPLLCGSESGFSVTPYGDWHYKELEVFVKKLGLSPLQAIKSATKDAAVSMRKDKELGLIAEDYLADLVIIDGDPSKDVSVLGRKDLIQNIILDGELVDLTPRPSRKRDPDGWRVSSYSERINKKKTN
ncbi:MAG: amidohydrolase family protein [Pseudomonadota bacterium]|nr:amidohydrolase family protein [Pseudomonadota bacterium]|tara:strand:+ start:32089 stop:33426 length:1338 start_codon:yes stop_codon:yes gene_type:complete